MQKIITNADSSSPTFLPNLDQAGIKQLQDETAKQLGRDRYFSDTLSSGDAGPELAIIPSGQYEMGSSNAEFGHSNAEHPQHYNHINKAFAIGRFTVTADDFDLFIKDTEWFLRPDLVWSTGQKPVINVRMSDASLYLEWLSEQTRQHYRFPSEAEWEYAARAGTTTAFHFGDEVSCKEVHFHSLFPYNEAKQKKRWYLPKCSPMATALDVGSKPANNWGLHEVHGNIWEMTQTPWHESHINSNRDGSFDNSSSNNSNSSFISAAIVTKGGSWFDDAIHSRSAARRKRLFDELDTNLGFRVVREL